MLAANAKHSFATEKVTTAIDRKFVVSERGERKGTRQLHDSIKRFLGGEDLGSTGLTREQIHTIHPMIIAADPALTGLLVGRYLDQKLERAMLRNHRKQVAIAPLQLATFTDIERLLPYTSCVSFTSFLETANSKNKHSLPSGNLRQRAGAAIVGVAPGNDPIKEEWDAISGALRELFPRPS